MTKYKIELIEARKSDLGKNYWRVKTDKGWLSCFDFDVAEKLKENVEYDLEVQQKGNYANIKGFVNEKEMEVQRVAGGYNVGFKEPIRNDKATTMSR